MGAAQPRRRRGRAKAQQAEPHRRRDAGPGREGRAQRRRLARAQAAQQHDGVQVDMGVEIGEGEGGRQRRPQADGRPGGLQPGSRLPGAPGGQQRIAQQEGRAAETKDFQQQRAALDQRAQAEHAQRDQQPVRQRADGDDGAHMLALEALAQHQRVLRADRQDQAGAHGPALHEHGRRGGRGQGGGGHRRILRSRPLFKKLHSYSSPYISGAYE